MRKILTNQETNDQSQSVSVYGIDSVTQILVVRRKCLHVT